MPVLGAADRRAFGNASRGNSPAQGNGHYRGLDPCSDHRPGHPVDQERAVAPTGADPLQSDGSRLEELARRVGSGRLFPRVKRSAARNKLSETFSKRFGYYRRKYHNEPHKVPNKDFHSFRGGALTTMVNAGETLETSQQILGHESDEVAIVHYYDGATERMLRNAVEKIAIDVSAVARPFGDRPAVVRLFGERPLPS